MKKLLAVALPAGLAVLLAVWATGTFRTRGEAYEARLERCRLKRDFAERAALARAIPPDRITEWRDEAMSLARWYFEEITAIRNRHPTEPARPAAAEPEREGKGGKAERDRALREEFQRYAEGRFALLKEGRYAALRSAADAGLRLDLLAVEKGASPEGGAPQLRIDVALWGAPRYVERERAGERVATRNVVPVSFKTLVFRFLDGSGKQVAEMSGGGEPYYKLADPERFVEDFPPGVLFGSYWVDFFPREAASVEIEFDASARGASGAERPASFKIAVPIADDWKIPPGATYQAEIRQVPATR
jgi:hypothetical protein